MSGTDIFISYSSEDKSIAHLVSEAVKSVGISTWIAPESIPAGARYASAIMKGLDECGLVLLIYSKHCNKSEHVANEIDKAVRSDKTIIPFCLDDSKMSEELDYYLSRKQHIIAYPNPEEMFDKLIHQIAAALNLDLDNIIKKEQNGEITTNQALYSLKVMPNVDCDVLIDGEVQGLAKANLISRFPLEKGEYAVSCVSKQTNERVELKDVVISDCDVLRKPVFKGLAGSLFDMVKSSNPIIETITDSGSKAADLLLSSSSLYPQNIGAEIHIDSDIDCNVFDYGKALDMKVNAFKDVVLYLKKGVHELKFISKQDQSISKDVHYVAPENDYCGKIEIRLQSQLNKLLSQKKREVEREACRKAEEEENRQIEQKQKEFDLRCENLKKVLPKSISFNLLDGKTLKFRLNSSMTQYSAVRHSDTSQLATSFLTKSLISGFLSKSKNVLNTDYFSIDDKIRDFLRSVGLNISVSEYEYTIDIFPLSPYSSKFSNMEYFEKMYLK